MTDHDVLINAKSRTGLKKVMFQLFNMGMAISCRHVVGLQEPPKKT